MRAEGCPTINCAELPALAADIPLAKEWDYYREVVVRLVAAGHEGRHVLIKGCMLIGLYDSHDNAVQVGNRRFPCGGFLVHQIREHEPVYLQVYERPNGRPMTFFALKPGNGLLGLQRVSLWARQIKIRWPGR